MGSRQFTRGPGKIAVRGHGIFSRENAVSKICMGTRQFTRGPGIFTERGHGIFSRENAVIKS